MAYIDEPLYIVLDLPGKYLRPGDILYRMAPIDGGAKAIWFPGHTGIYSETVGLSPDQQMIVESNPNGLISHACTKQGGVRAATLQGFIKTSGSFYMGARRPAGAGPDKQRQARDSSVKQINKGYLAVGQGDWQAGCFSCVGLVEYAYEEQEIDIVTGGNRLWITPLDQFQRTDPVSVIEVAISETIHIPVYAILKREVPFAGDYYERANFVPSANSLPAGSSYQDGTFTWTPTNDDGGKIYTVYFSADNSVRGGNYHRQQSLTINVAPTPNHPPTTPHTPSPADMATNQSVAPTLTWQGGDPDSDAVTYTIHFGTTKPPPQVTTSHTETSYGPGILITNTTYYWQIIAKDAPGLTSTGPIWRFTTTGTATGNDTGEMILIPAGNFQMGCDASNPAEGCYSDEQPLHTVNLDAYYIDKYEVTNARYKACVDAGGCTPPRSSSSYSRDAYYGNATYNDYPVIYVDWFQAKAYCEYAGKRLPTEAEWEKAARGSQDTRKYPWGDTAPTCTLVNGYLNGYCVGDTSRVGSNPSGASPYGVLDMSGNVWEWVNDWYQSDYYYNSPASNPQGPVTGNYRILRGGSWYYGDLSVYFLRAASRDGNNPDGRSVNFGFRCVRSQ